MNRLLLDKPHDFGLNQPSPIRLLLVTIGIAALIVTGLVLLGSPNNGHVALYFSKYDGKVSAKTISFSFMVENNFGQDKDLGYVVLVDGNRVSQGKLRVEKRGKKTESVSIPFEIDILRLKKISVQLVDFNREIYFWAGLKPKASFVNQLALIFADATPSVVKKDGNLLLEFEWKAAVRIDQNYLIFVHFTKEDGSIAFQQDHFPEVDGNIIQTSQWTPNQTIKERFVYPIPPGVLDGNYRMQVGFFIPGEPRVKTIRGDDFAVIKTISVEG